jgi:hypothetical protein
MEPLRWMDLERTPRLQLELEPPMKSGVAAVTVLVEGLVEGGSAPRARPGVPSVRDPLMGLL